MNISPAPAQRVSDPGAPQLRWDVTGLLCVAIAVAAFVAVRFGGGWGELAVVGVWLLAAEFLTVQLNDGTSVPLAAGVVIPLVVVADAGAVVAVAAGAAFAAAALARSRTPARVGFTVATRAVSAIAAWVTYRLVLDAVQPPTAWTTISALAAAGAAVLIVELAARRLRRGGSFAAAGGYWAVLAVGSSGVLMGLGLDGVAGAGAMGLWAIPVFAIPALSARWAFDRLHAIRRTYDQTVEVLSAVPEMGGKVRPGHSRRVANLSLEMARMLDVSRPAMVDLERAALLHALGSVTFDDDTAAAPTPEEVAAATFSVLGEDAPLSGPAGLVAGMAGRGAGGRGGASAENLPADILRVAAAYEDLSGGDPSRARGAVTLLTQDPAMSAKGGRDGRVLIALARIVAHRSTLAARG